MNIEEVRKIYNELMNSKINDYYKLVIKCWLFNSENRFNNGNLPFTLEEYDARDMTVLIKDYIKFDLINVDDFGGKEIAIKIVADWNK